MGQDQQRSRRKIYGAAEVTADAKVRGQIKKLQEDGYGHYPVCVAKTQYSFSTDPQLRGAPRGHVINVREVRLAAGAEFVVMVCGDIMTMPGLPKVPSANKIDLGRRQGRRAVLGRVRPRPPDQGGVAAIAWSMEVPSWSTISSSWASVTM